MSIGRNAVMSLLEGCGGERRWEVRPPLEVLIKRATYKHLSFDLVGLNLKFNIKKFKLEFDSLNLSSSDLSIMVIDLARLKFV